MITKELKAKILDEIETRMVAAARYSTGAYNGMKEIRDYINSLPEEPVSKDLEDAAINHAESLGYTSEDYEYKEIVESYKAGAKWDRQRTINKACEWLDKYASDFVALADDSHPAIGDTQAFYGTKSLLHYFRQEMED